MKLSYPTPGKVNACPGLSLVFEEAENVGILLHHLAKKQGTNLSESEMVGFEEMAKRHGVPISSLGLPRNLDEGLQLNGCSYSYRWPMHIIDKPTKSDLSRFRDREFAKRAIPTCPCALQHNTLGIRDVDHLLTDNCQTTEELLGSFSQTLSNAEFIIMRLFLTNNTQKVPAALVSVSDLGCWIGSGQGIAEIQAYVKNVDNKTTEFNDSTEKTDAISDNIITDNDTQSENIMIGSAARLINPKQNDRNIGNQHHAGQEKHIRFRQKTMIEQEESAKQNDKNVKYSRDCKQLTGGNQLMYEQGHGGSGGGGLAGLGGALAGLFGGLFGGLSSLGASVNNALTSQVSGAASTLANLSDNLADAATGMDNDFDMGNDGNHGESSHGNAGEDSNDQANDKNDNGGDNNKDDKDDNNRDDKDKDEDDDDEKTTSTPRKTTASTTTTTTATTNTSTSTTTTTTTTTTQPSDVCLIYPQTQRSKRMVHEEEQGHDCRCIFEKLRSEIKGNAVQYVGQCGQATDDPDPFEDIPDDKLLPLKEIFEQNVPDNAYGSPHMLDTIR